MTVGLIPMMSPRTSSITMTPMRDVNSVLPRFAKKFGYSMDKRIMITVTRPVAMNA